MYRDLVIADSNGRIVANSKSENRDKLMHECIRAILVPARYADLSLRTIWSSDVCNSDLENEETSSFTAVEF